MSWAVGTNNDGRDIGYGVPAICDHPGCNKPIDRGISFACGGMHDGGDSGCGLYFCNDHLFISEDGDQLCHCCIGEEHVQFTPTPDTKEWLHHKLVDPSWHDWRQSNKSKVLQMKVEEFKAKPKLNPVKEFIGQYRFLSNFFPCPNGVYYDGAKYPTAEHAYVAAKTDDHFARRLISVIDTPGQVKRFGKSVKFRPDWDSIKIDAMREIVESKFERNGELRNMLICTKDRQLIEGNSWGDTFWGVCRGVGDNNLGKILMAVRDQITKDKDA